MEKKLPALEVRNWLRSWASVMQVALRRALLILGLLVATAALAQVPPPSKNLAPGFAGMRVGDKLLLMPIDVELF